MALMVLAFSLSVAGLFTRNAYSLLLNPEVDVIPPEAGIGQQVVVKAEISVVFS